MEKPIVVKKQKLKKGSVKNEELTLTDANRSAKKSKEILKNKKTKVIEFIEAE